MVSKTLNLQLLTLLDKVICIVKHWNLRVCILVIFLVFATGNTLDLSGTTLFLWRMEKLLKNKTFLICNLTSTIQAIDVLLLTITLVFRRLFLVRTFLISVSRLHKHHIHRQPINFIFWYSSSKINEEIISSSFDNE